jgi:hypothetical protein
MGGAGAAGAGVEWVGTTSAGGLGTGDERSGSGELSPSWLVKWGSRGATELTGETGEQGSRRADR